VRGQGVYLFTGDGRKLLDGISSWWVNIHGHAHPRLNQAIADQAKKIAHVIFAGAIPAWIANLLASALRGAGNVRVVVADARERRPDGETYDRVLVDPPCSGLGTLQARPDLRWRVGQDATAEEKAKLRADLGLDPRRRHAARRAARALARSAAALRAGSISYFTPHTSADDLGCRRRLA